MFLVACTKDIDNEHLTHKGAISNYSNKLESNQNKSTLSNELEPNLSNFEKILTDPEYDSWDENTQKFLTTYINQHNEELKSIKTLKDLSNKALKTQQLIFTGCSDKNLNHCQYFSKLKRIYGMREYLLKLALLNEATDIFKYYYYLNAAYEISNSRFDRDIFTLYLKHYKEYAEIIKENTSLKDIHDLYISQIVAESDRLIDNDTFKDFIASYTFPNNSPLNKVDASVLKVLTNLKGNEFFENKLKKYIDNDISYLKQVDNFKNEDIQYFAKTLKISPIKQDIYYYIISSAYHNKKSHDSLKTTWKYYGLTTQELAERVDTFVKLQFLKVLRLAHKNIVNYFHERKYTPNTFFANAIARSEEAYPYFQNLFQNIEYLDSFLRTLLLSGNKQYQESYQHLAKTLFSNLDTNIKYMVTFPQMMMLLFEFAQKGLALNFKTFWGGINHIPSDKIIKSFFDGTYKAFFKYSSDYSEILDEEIPYVFYFALNTGLFRDFSNKNEELQLVSNFLKIVADQLSLKSINRLSQDYDLFLNNHKTNTHYKNFLNLCNETPQYRHRLSLSDIDESVYQGIDLGGHLAMSTGIYSASFERNFERIRADIEPVHKKISLMISMYEDYLRKFETDEKKIQEISASLHQSLAPINHLKTSYLTQYWNRLQEYEKCYYQTALKEKKLQASLIEYEEKYLRDLYQKYHKLTSKDDANTLTQIKENFPSLNKFKEGKYYYTKLDFLLRVKNYLEEGWSFDDETLPALSPNLKIIPPQDDYSWNRHEFYRESESKYKHIIDIENLNEDDFVKTALLTVAIDYHRNPYGFTRWFKAGDYRTFSISTFTFKTLEFASLYKMGKFDIYTNETCTIQPTSKGCQVINKKITPQDLIDIGIQAKDFLHIKDNELETLEKVGVKTRLDRIQYSMAYLLMNPQTKKPNNWGIYDYIYYAIKSPLLADFANFPWSIVDENVTQMIGNRKSHLQRAEDYHIARQNRGNLIFSMNEKLEKTISDSYKELAWTEIDQIKEFETALFESEEAQNLIGPLRYETDQIVHKELLDLNLVDEVNSIINSFHLKTNYFYKR